MSPEKVTLVSLAPSHSIVIYTCILTRDTRVNSSVENTFIESSYLQVRLV